MSLTHPQPLPNGEGSHRFVSSQIGISPHSSRWFGSNGNQFGDSDQIIGDDVEEEVAGNAGEAAVLGFSPGSPMIGADDPWAPAPPATHTKTSAPDPKTVRASPPPSLGAVNQTKPQKAMGFSADC